MKKLNGGSVQAKVSKFLARYRITPQSTTGASPASLMLGRRVRCPLDKFKPNLAHKVLMKQTSQKMYHDAHAKDREINESANVYCRNYGRSGEKYIPGVVQRRTGPVSMEVMTDQGIMRRHQDQVFTRSDIEPRQDTPTESNKVLRTPVPAEQPKSIPQAVPSSVPGGEPPGPPVRRNPTRAKRGIPAPKLTY